MMNVIKIIFIDIPSAIIILIIMCGFYAHYRHAVKEVFVGKPTPAKKQLRPRQQAPRPPAKPKLYVVRDPDDK